KEMTNKSDVLLKIYSPEYGLIKIRDDISMQFAEQIIQVVKGRLRHKGVISDSYKTSLLGMFFEVFNALSGEDRKEVGAAILVDELLRTGKFNEDTIREP